MSNETGSEPQEKTPSGPTKYHYHGRKLVLCLECNCAPCDPDCTAQMFPPAAGNTRVLETQLRLLEEGTIE
jgi:hypothetical protein